MASQRLRAWGLIAIAVTLLWTVLAVIDLSSAEAMMGGSRGGGFGGGFRSGFQGGVGHGFRGGISHGFHGGFGHGFQPGFRDHGFHHRFHHGFHDHFFFSVGIGGFFPFYPVAYPYPVAYHYPAYYPAYAPAYQYSPCGYYDPNGVWVNAPCPQYAPPVSAPQQGGSSQGVFAPPAQSSEGAVEQPQSPGY